MPAQVLIIHGWSDTSKSFRQLRDYLVGNGYDVQQVWLGDYISLDDDVRIEDAANRMHSVVRDLIDRNEVTVPFDLIVHSTGGLVARQWIVSHYPNGQDAPVKRLIMLAPANFGSRLASLGKSMIGRIAKGWNNWFQTGEEMLSALELASPFQLELAKKDLLDPNGGAVGPYGDGKIWPFVLIGTHPYTDGTRQIANEAGADGTVRVAAANMNAVGLTIDFSDNAAEPRLRPWSKRAGNTKFPFAVLPDREHSSIVQPSAPTKHSKDAYRDRLGPLIMQALGCQTDQQYEAIASEWEQISEETASFAQNEAARLAAFNQAPDAKVFQQFFQVVTRVRDDHGQPVDDYFLEFFVPSLTGDQGIVRFQREVLSHVHVNGNDPSLRCLYVNRSVLLDEYYPQIRDKSKRHIATSISASAIGKNVHYFEATKVGAKGHLFIHAEGEAQRQELTARLHRNMTHFFDIIIPRRPSDKVFRLSR